MNKFFLIAISIIIIIAIVIGGFYISVKKGSSNYSGLTVANIIMNDDVFKATIFQTSSGKSFRDYYYQISGKCIYITVYSGIVTDSYSSDSLQIEVADPSISEIDKVYFKDGDNIKLIYEKNS